MKQNIKPTLNRVLIRVSNVTEETKNDSGLFIPVTAEKKDASNAIILQVGPKCEFAQVGQKIIINTFTGIGVLTADFKDISSIKDDVRILNENDILAIVE